MSQQVSQDCESVWNRTLQLWSSTDALVAQLIAHTKGGRQELFLIDEDRTKQIELECEDLARVRHECSKQDCKKDIEDLLKIVVRNMWKIKPKLPGRQAPTHTIHAMEVYASQED